MFSQETIEFAASFGIDEDELKLICNGCSGGVSWFYKHVSKKPCSYVCCCNRHDLSYQLGGTEKDRRDADRRFRQCVKESGRPIRAWLYWACVRIFSWFAWNYSK